ncbi:MAG: hypothetical protein ACR2PL_21230 [Dehalococcoidia bacterium]
MVSGGVLGAVLLAWLALTFFAPGFGMVLAVFGSPVFAFFIILRLLTLPPRGFAVAQAGRMLSEFEQDPDLLRSVVAQNGAGCSTCGNQTSLRLQPVLPVGTQSADLERRFVALCEPCYSARHRRSGQ